MLMTYDSNLYDERLKSLCDKTNAKLSLLETKIAKQTSLRKDAKLEIPFEETINTPPNHASRPVTASACTFCSSKRQWVHNAGCICLNKVTDSLKKKKEPVRVVKYYVKKPHPVKPAAGNSEKSEGNGASESTGKPKLTKPTLYRLVLHLGTVKEAEGKVSRTSDRPSARDDDSKDRDWRKIGRSSARDDDDERYGRKDWRRDTDHRDTHESKDSKNKQITSVFNALVYISLIGKRASLHNHKLLQRNGKPAVLQQGKVAEFYIRTEDLGEIRACEVEVSKSEKRDRSKDSDTARSSRPASEASSVVSTARDSRTKEDKSNDKTAQQSSKALVHAFLLHRVTIDKLSESTDAEKKTPRERTRTQFLFECGQVLYEGSSELIRLSNVQKVSDKPSFLDKPGPKKKRSHSAEKSKKDKSEQPTQSESEYKLAFKADRNLLLEDLDVILIAKLADTGKSDEKQRSRSEIGRGKEKNREDNRDVPDRRTSPSQERLTKVLCKPTWKFDKKEGSITMQFRAANLDRIEEVWIECDRNMKFKKFRLFKLMTYEEIYEHMATMRKRGKLIEALKETRDSKGERSFALRADKGKFIDLYDLRTAAKQRSQSLRAKRDDGDARKSDEKTRQRNDTRSRSEMRRERDTDSRTPDVLESVFKLELPYAMEYTFEFDRIISSDGKSSKQKNSKEFLAFACNSSKVAFQDVKTHLKA